MPTTKAGISGGKVRVVEGLVKFPRTPHLVWLGGSSPRGDELMAAAEAGEWLCRPMSVEERSTEPTLGSRRVPTAVSVPRAGDTTWILGQQGSGSPSGDGWRNGRSGSGPPSLL